MVRELIDFAARNIKSYKQRVKNYHYYSEDSEFNFFFNSDRMDHRKAFNRKPGGPEQSIDSAGPDEKGETVKESL